MSEPAAEALASDRVAVVTGAALGIGRAAALRFATLGMKVVLIDLPGPDLDATAGEVAALAGTDRSFAAPHSVTDQPALDRLAADVAARWGPPSLLMCSAVTRVGGGVTASADDWRTAFSVNLFGVMGTVNAFLPSMHASGTRGLVVIAGSKQGITNPPGNAAYNATKAALKSYAEQLAHHLRSQEGCRVSAHLLVPGWTTTGKREHKPGAWLPDQVVDRMMAGLTRDSFYIVCPDGEVSEAMDRKRILWGALDIVEDRPALSRWHPAHAEAFRTFEAGGAGDGGTGRRLAARDVVAMLQLERHPEGGWYRETFRDPAMVAGRACSTAIYFLLEGGEASRWHRVDAAEVWHWYAGDPLELVIASSAGGASRVRLSAALADGDRPQAVVPAGTWQQARSLGAWTLVGCTVAPGFSFEGFELAPPGWVAP